MAHQTQIITDAQVSPYDRSVWNGRPSAVRVASALGLCPP